MAWSRMSFKGQTVWVKVGDDGRPALDSDGRAEMKYRQEDRKSYRPAPSNLAPAAEGSVEATPAPRAPSAPRPATRLASSSSDPNAIQVWTDGACSGNPGPMGIGVVVVADGKRVERGEYLGVGTNNIAELTAIARGLQVASEMMADRNRAVNVYSDSSYALGLLGKGWKAKANQELVASLRRQVADFPKLHLVKVEGHAGVSNNERCDELAREAVARRR